MGSNLGRLFARLGGPRTTYNRTVPYKSMSWRFSHKSQAEQLKKLKDDWNLGNDEIMPLSWPVFGRCSDGNFRVAHWLAVLFFATLGIVSSPWIKWRFSLRTLLIATTLVAVVLGLIVWLR